MQPELRCLTRRARGCVLGRGLTARTRLLLPAHALLRPGARPVHTTGACTRAHRCLDRARAQVPRPPHEPPLPHGPPLPYKHCRSTATAAARQTVGVQPAGVQSRSTTTAPHRRMANPTAQPPEHGLCRRSMLLRHRGGSCCPPRGPRCGETRNGRYYWAHWRYYWCYYSTFGQ